MHGTRGKNARVGFHNLSSVWGDGCRGRPHHFLAGCSHDSSCPMHLSRMALKAGVVNHLEALQQAALSPCFPLRLILP